MQYPIARAVDGRIVSIARLAALRIWSAISALARRAAAAVPSYLAITMPANPTRAAQSAQR